MFQYLENLRKKPEGERKRVILKISFLVTLVIALFWGISVSYRIDHADFSMEPKEESTENETPSLKDSFSNFMNQIGDIIQGETSYESTESSQ